MSERLKESLYTLCKNKAGYTATKVTCGAVMISVNHTFGQEQRCKGCSKPPHKQSVTNRRTFQQTLRVIEWRAYATKKMQEFTQYSAMV